MISSDELQRAQAEISEEELEGVAGGQCKNTGESAGVFTGCGAID